MPFCPRSSVRLERHRAKVEVASAIPAVDAILPLCLSSHRTRFVNSYGGRVLTLGASPTRGSILNEEGRMQNEESGDLPIPRSAFFIHHSAFLFHGDHDVTAASRPVKAFVPVRIRLVTPISMGRR